MLPVYNKATKAKVSVVGEAVIATDTTYVHLPKFLAERNLLSIGDKITAIGLFNIIVNGEYFTIVSPLMYTLPYNSFQVISVDGEEYYQLEFLKGQSIIESLTVARNAMLTTEVLTFILLRGQIPYYVTQEMALHLTSGSAKYGGVKLDENSALIELLAGLSQRVKGDEEMFYRHAPASAEVQYVPLTDISFGTFSNFSRFLGGYQRSGIITSLVNDTPTAPTKLEKTLRR